MNKNYLFTCFCLLQMTLLLLVFVFYELSLMFSIFQLPQIGHFIFLTLKTLNIYEVPQYELERMLLMPRASRTLAMLLTSLLSSPQQRQKLSEKPYMPYKVWARKLAHKTLLWYRCYYRENQDSQKVRTY